MNIEIDIEDSLPVFAQLIEQIKSAVLNNQLKAGDPLPSIRQLANDLEVNNKTVAKAFKFLERDGVIETKGYRGTYIHPDAKINSGIDINALIHTRLQAVVKELKAVGATDSELRIAFKNIVNDN
ncbi:GntR family transcriptional regulator [Pleionea sp. CnH1-48]|uniref:GntR family transcriptional regulator n=1 Tax=Pleionea sp. CnH1-48 TaxID=2954494 RepID=UPI0020981B93|nr:GntR family transcriptional regulator [Pleionea sp. CnH1-48]